MIYKITNCKIKTYWQNKKYKKIKDNLIIIVIKIIKIIHLLFKSKDLVNLRKKIYKTPPKS
jgi:hypothetical protein